MAYWLMKSEPSEVSFDDLWRRPKKTVDWFGIRNYQARNFMRDQMRIGDEVLFYHSSCPIPGVAGVARIASAAYPDPTQFQADTKYFDPKSSQESPRWLTIDVQAVLRTPFLSLAQMRQMPALAEMRLLQRGNRLSITPVEASEWRTIQQFFTQQT